jgi:hypothetical protein
MARVTPRNSVKVERSMIPPSRCGACLTRAAILTSAQADCLGSMGLDRRRALWTAMALEEEPLR